MEKLWPWAQVVACALYCVWPLDVLPDPVPFVGMADDFFAMWHMIRQLQVTGTLSQAA
jgi:uncharacterized membrane protein YkvA (DUF1232 family)